MVPSLFAGRDTVPADALTSRSSLRDRTSLYGLESLEGRVFMAAHTVAPDLVQTVEQLKIPALTNQLRRAGVDLSQLANVTVQPNSVSNLAASGTAADPLTTITGTVNAVIRGPAGTVTQALDFELQQGLQPGDCPILDLMLGPIDLDLLGLVVETSEICLNVSAEPGPGNLLGNLLCGLTGILDGPLGGLNLGAVSNTVNQIVGGLNLNMTLDSVSTTANNLVANITTTLGVGGLLDSVTSALILDPQHDADSCAILNLDLGPIDLNLLGLVVQLDNCEGGPVEIDITAEPGPGNLLGNLLCGITGLLDGGLNLGGLNRLVSNLNRLLDRLDRLF